MKTEWTYECSCLECDWRAVWSPNEKWATGAAAKHANDTGHRVKAVSTKVLVPDEKPPPAEPLSTDRHVAFCETCRRYLGVNGGRLFTAAWKSHARRTGHPITVRPNPNFRGVVSS